MTLSCYILFFFSMMEEDTSKPGCRHSRVLTGAIASMVEASIHSFIHSGK